MAGSKSSGNTSKRQRNWTVIVYPDSAPENWRDVLDDLHIEWIESPLHEFDTNPTGETKKAHWHVILLFGGLKTYEQVCEVVAPLRCPRPEVCLSVKGATRYMAHLDNPEKFQYSISDIKAHGGVDLGELLRASATDRYAAIREMCEFCKQERIVEFQDLMDYAMAERYDSWFPLLCDNSSFVIAQYIKSQRHRNSPSNSKDAGKTK